MDPNTELPRVFSPPSLPPRPMDVNVVRSARPDTTDSLLWEVIKDRTAALSFERYAAFIDNVFEGRLPVRPVDDPHSEKARQQDLLTSPNLDDRTNAREWLRKRAADEAKAEPPREGSGLDRATVLKRLAPHQQRAARFFDGDAYELLKRATEIFVFHEAGRLEEVFSPRHSHLLEPPTSYLSPEIIDRLREAYRTQLTPETDSVVLPYLDVIRGNLEGLPIKASVRDGVEVETYGIVRSRITSPVLVELLWNYWQEQGLLMQTMNLISLRFQNIRRGRGVDPLAALELDPLRPLANMIWGFIQDDMNRLTVARRAYEYAHGLGLQLVGKAIPEMHPADVRTQFLPAFHDLLRLAWTFFREDDDKMVVADAFPLLNALRELHFVIAEGAHNQFGDLPLRARIEMLMQQWILARPEMREFLRGRTMVPYPEPWMDRIDAMKALQGWNDASVINYNDLAVFGEQIILGVRYGRWSDASDSNQAANWAKVWRPAIQRYTHALKIVSGIDLSIADAIEVRTQAERLAQGVPSARTPYPGGVMHRVAPPPESQPLGARPGADKLLRPVPVSSPAQVRGTLVSPPRSR